MSMVIEKNWAKVLQEEMEKPYVRELKSFIYERAESGMEIYPPLPKVFEALKKAPFEKVKVVIMGQDPYHGPGQAHGMSFSVMPGVRIPPSLRNIYKEIEADLGITPPNHGNLEHWAGQGVLLLNATLTVERGAPKSHYGKGWERFTDAVIEKLCERSDPLIFILWGKSAQEKAERILSVKNHPHKVLTSAHPSPYSADRFFGCRHFSKANEMLKAMGKEPIDWSLPPQ